MIVLKERDGQALLKHVEERADRKRVVKYEWWNDTKKMKDGIRLEEKNGKTHIYCYSFYGEYRETWLMEEFDRRVSKYQAV